MALKESSPMKYLKIKVIPKSPKNEIIENDESFMKIRIKAAPEKGRANAELIKFLSKELKIPKENIVIISGKTERTKLIRIK